jgi:DNA-binding NarL/FixJ family response regulator
MTTSNGPDTDTRASKDKTPEKKRIKVYIVDDHPVVRQGLNLLLRMESDMVCCGEAETVPEALRGIEAAKPDVAVVDLSLRDTSGLELVKDLHAYHPTLPVVVLSMHDETLYAERVLKAGAKAYLMKDEAQEAILAAIRKVASGGLYLSERMSGRLLSMFLQGSTGPGDSLIGQLSDREIEVFELIGRGVTTREIAGKLNLSIKTVEAHREHIKKKMKLSDATELLQHAIHWVQNERPI